MNRDQWRAICMQELGKPYIWGAEGPHAYDCSGFAQFALAHLNLDPPGDQTAAGLHRFYSRGRSTPVTAEQSDLGDLVFFGSEESVTHIGLGWGGEEMIEAGGGGRNTTTQEIARQQKAEVRIKPIARRRDLVAILRPHALPWAGATARVEATTESPAGPGRYTNAPPLAQWLEDGRHMRLKRPFGYVDASGREWPVPAETVVDGASIPQVFWSLTGGPFSGAFRDASIVHDYYCDVRTRPWRDTHRVFLDAMLCSGVSEVQAQVMYYAVYRFGPRWTLGPAAVAEGFESAEAPLSVPTPLPVEVFDAATFEADARAIRKAKFDIAQIEALADARRLQPAGPKASAMPPVDTEHVPLANEAGAAFGRMPLVQRLVALQDAAPDAATAESVGSLLSAYSAQALARTTEAELESGTSFADLAQEYRYLFETCVIRPERASEVAWHRKKLLQYRARYEAVSARTGVPWWFIGIVHALEASFNFQGHLHNGDPLSGRTVRVPAKRPLVWNPPNDWESSAVDALEMKGFTHVDDWSVAVALHRWESYNGFGYHANGIHSPYLWSFSNHYSRGKYVEDHQYDPDAVSRQCGGAVMLKALQEAGAI